MSKANSILSNKKLREGILNLMKDANEAIMRVYEVQNNEVEIKNDNTPVTKADLAANRILTDGLKKLFPEIPTVSEEDRFSINIPKKIKFFG